MNNKENAEWKIPLYKIYSDDEDLNLITKIVKRGNRWAIGPEIEELENKISEYVGTDYCVTFNSGTSALHASLLSHNIKNSDEVIIPSFSFISTANAVLFVNATPIFSDIENETYGLDPNLIEEKISKNTKIIMPMDYGGISCRINEIKEISDSNNLILLEDAAEGLGASVNEKKVGSVSDLAIFSFCGNKVLTTGEGGATVTNSKETYEKLKSIRSHGRIDKINYFENPNNAEYMGIGYNWRMSSMTAALGISQLQKLDKMIKMRQENAEFLISRLSKHSEIIFPRPPNGYNHIYQMFTIRLKTEEIRNKLQKYLLNKRIFCKIYFNPIHMTDFYKNKFPQKKGQLENTEKVSSQVLTLPIYPNMTNEEKNYLTDSIAEFFEFNN